MMTPSAARMILTYARVARHAAFQRHPLAATSWFASGYLLAWTGFSSIATFAQGTGRPARLKHGSKQSNSRRRVDLSWLIPVVYAEGSLLTAMSIAAAIHLTAWRVQR